MLAVALVPCFAWADSDQQDTVLNAAVNSESHLVQVLRSGTPIDAIDSDGETALMRAADKGNVRAIELLLKHGAQIDKRDEDGRTALMFAAQEGHTEAVKFLLHAGANPTLKDEDGQSALNFAEDEKHADTADVLRAALAK